MNLSDADERGLRVALDQAEESFRHRAIYTRLGKYVPGIPIGAAMSFGGDVFAWGHNQRVQNDDPTAHGEMSCIRNARGRTDYAGVTLYTTLSPCLMCTGAILQFGIPRVIVGSRPEFFHGNLEILEQHGVEVGLKNDPIYVKDLIELIHRYPEVWHDDIAGRDRIVLR